MTSWDFCFLSVSLNYQHEKRWLLWEKQSHVESYWHILILSRLLVKESHISFYVSPNVCEQLMPHDPTKLDPLFQDKRGDTIHFKQWTSPPPSIRNLSLHNPFPLLLDNSQQMGQTSVSACCAKRSGVCETVINWMPTSRQPHRIPPRRLWYRLDHPRTIVIQTGSPRDNCDTDWITPGRLWYRLDYPRTIVIQTGPPQNDCDTDWITPERLWYRLDQPRAVVIQTGSPQDDCDTDWITPGRLWYRLDHPRTIVIQTGSPQDDCDTD